MMYSNSRHAQDSVQWLGEVLDVRRTGLDMPQEMTSLSSGV